MLTYEGARDSPSFPVSPRCCPPRLARVWHGARFRCYWQIRQTTSMPTSHGAVGPSDLGVAGAQAPGGGLQ